MQVPLASSSQPIQLNNFYHAIQLYHDRPHLINRKLCGASTLFYYKVSYNSGSSTSLADVINYTSLFYETIKIRTPSKGNLNNLLLSLLQPYDKNVLIEEVTHQDLIESLQGVFITIRLLLPSHNKSSNTVEVVIFNKNEHYVMFVSSSTKDKYLLIAPPFCYKFMIQNGVMQLVVNIEDADSASGEWLADKLFPKVLKWCEEFDESVVRQESLGLISVEMYCELYKVLKEKYGRKMVEIWPENTDPLKFVYEDVAIATYLICLWRKSSESNENETKPYFVDLGCGNGLLVYILNQEGYPGLGLDVRKRKIWDLYPPTTNLQVKTIIPSDANLFPEADWIIGNHSDELTPWIPVITARSSPKCNFFLLPCCCYNFDASKYIRKNPALSQYAEYLQYIESISSFCGFITKVDRLRIPSTKRTCLVTFGRDIMTIGEINRKIENLINPTSLQAVMSSSNSWIHNYQAREAKEKVRNCTQLDRNFVNIVIRKLAQSLLNVNDNGIIMLKKIDNSEWNAGGCLDISELVGKLDNDDLQQLKKECGGLQTLMRNHRYIFDVSKGRVKLRPPYLRSDTEKYVSKPCWFLKNHPNGCLYVDSECGYSHLN